MTRRTATILAALVALALSLITAPAHAATRQYFKTTTSTICLYGGNLTGATGPVATRRCAASNNMVWTWEGLLPPGQGGKFKGAAQGTCLDSNSAGSVYMNRCATTANQFWEVYRNDERGWLMIENWQTHLCLTHPSSAGGVTAHRCNRNDSTQWWRAANRP